MQRAGWARPTRGCVAVDGHKTCPLDCPPCVCVFLFVQEQQPEFKENSASGKLSAVPQPGNPEVCLCLSQHCTYTVARNGDVDSETDGRTDDNLWTMLLTSAMASIYIPEQISTMHLQKLQPVLNSHLRSQLLCT